VLGHVDTGKTTLLDKIRGSAVASREIGSMTQHIGASFFPLETLKEICGPLNQKTDIKINGLLIIDTPGHSMFMNLRRRGGSVADMAVLVLDINRGFETQTYESISILKNRKTPFIVAANKIDLIPGWVEHPDTSFLESYKNQRKIVQRQLDDLLYIIMGSFSRQKLRTERFDRIRDFTKNVAIVPISANTGAGIPELVAVLIGLTQQYMKDKLVVSTKSAKGTVLEVKEEPGLGMTINAIIYDGILHVGDTLVIGGKMTPIITKLRAILLPKPLDEIRDPKDRFTLVKEAPAAAGVKLVAPDIDDVLAGAPIYVAELSSDIEKYVNIISEEVQKFRIVTDKVGIILKTDTLGSLEAIVNELVNRNIPIRTADVGDVSRREVIEATVVRNESPLHGVILAFNVNILPEAMNEAQISGVPLFENNIVYHLIEEYDEWLKKEREAKVRRELDSLVRPGKIRVLRGFIFRKSKPAIFGVDVLSGKIKTGYSLIGMDGKVIGEIQQIQDKSENIQEALMGQRIAISVKGPTAGRNFNESDILYVAVPQNHLRELKLKYGSILSSDEIDILNELIHIMRREKPLWGL
jgi:translation initiation factor 5B